MFLQVEEIQGKLEIGDIILNHTTNTTRVVVKLTKKGFITKDLNKQYNTEFVYESEASDTDYDNDGLGDRAIIFREDNYYKLLKIERAEND